MRPLQLSLFAASPPAEAGQPKLVRVEPPRPPVALAALPESRGEARTALRELPPDARAACLMAERLRPLLREPVEVELTDNAWTMVSFRRVEGRLRFRLHHMFLAACEAVLKAVAGFAGPRRRAAGRVIDDYIRQHRHLIKQGEGRAEPALEPRGEVHDLLEIYERLNRDHFAGRVQARIGWGRRSPGRRRRSIKMGVYFHERKLIKIHPALDDAKVPRHFVELVVFHEMLHQTVPPTVGEAGRRCVHGPEFRAAERAFPDYELARAWEKANLGVLLRKAP